MTLPNRLHKDRPIPRITALVGALLFCLLPVHLSYGGTMSKTVTTYKVSSLGMNIGNVSTSQQLSEDRGRTRVNFETKTRVKADLLWFGYRLESLEKGILLDGVLVSYSRTGEENGTRVDSEGTLQGDTFRFTIKENGLARSIVIPRSSYDYTTMECPEAFIDFSGNEAVTLRILDVEMQTVVNRVYRFVRNASYPVGKEAFPCRIVDFSDQNKSVRRWIQKNGNAIVVYRQDNTDAKNTYSVKATAVTKEI